MTADSDFFDSAYRTKAPWDVGQAQPALLTLVEEFPPLDPVLEVGCGTGDLALTLAERGFSVVAVDLAEAAVAVGRAKAAKVEVSVRERLQFRVADALRPTLISDPIRTVVDSGFFHLFDSSERQRFVQELATKIPIGGRYYLLGFAFQPPMPNAPREVTTDELRSLFAAEQGWNILALRAAQFVTVRGNVPAVAACIERASSGKA